MNKMQSSAGFTLVELITVILILGILAATALPKFMDVTDQAHEAGFSGAAGGFGSALALVHAQWIANGIATAGVVNGFGGDDTYVNGTGWPRDSNGGTLSNNANPADGDCVNIWMGIMQNPPVAFDGNVAQTIAAGADYSVTSPGADTCLYTYAPGGAWTTAGTISYDLTNGTITVVNPVR